MSASACPFHPTALPPDGTPLRPSPVLAEWREQAPATPLTYTDGHEGLIATRYELARAILEDPRFSVADGAGRMPLGPTNTREYLTHGGEPKPVPSPEPLDEAARRSERASLLSLDGEEHSRLRRAITGRFSIKQVRSRGPWLADTVSTSLREFIAGGSPSDLWRHFAQPIAARVHCRVLGVPDDRYDQFVDLFVGGSTLQAKYDFIREIMNARTSAPAEDVIGDLMTSEVVSREEAEGLLLMLMSSGRDSVAYLIATATVALLTNPRQWRAIREEPDLIDPAIEEFMRTGAMFVTLFPRTAREDVEIAGQHIAAGTSVSVSPVAANRDPRRWPSPEDLDVRRDAYGHLGFGHGIHGCIGQQLARREIREALTQLVTTLPGLSLVRADQLEPLPFAHPVATYEAGAVIVEW